jgi:hypothetical protein
MYHLPNSAAYSRPIILFETSHRPISLYVRHRLRWSVALFRRTETCLGVSGTLRLHREPMLWFCYIQKSSSFEFWSLPFCCVSKRTNKICILPLCLILSSIELCVIKNFLSVLHITHFTNYDQQITHRPTSLLSRSKIQALSPCRIMSLAFSSCLLVAGVGGWVTGAQSTWTLNSL